ncbi:MAG: hypothetical protein Q7T49_01915 [bacterium]|nr:hypothetical protein [bacterium]
MDQSEHEDGLSELDKKLYIRDSRPVKVRRSELSPTPAEFKSNWGVRQMTKATRPHRPEFWSVNALTKFFFGAIGFFILALLVAGFFLFRGSNIISNANIVIDVTGPLSVKSGGNLDLGIAITNKNRSELQTADLIIEYPSGTRDPKDPAMELSRVREPLGIIKPGQTLVHGVRAILFGSEKSEPVVVMRLEYRLAGSDAIFEKEKTFQVTLADSPVTINLILPPEINADKNIEATVEVVTNSPSILKNVALLALWPPGFSLKQSSVEGETVGGSTLWRLGDMAPGAKRSFKINGVLTGQDEELKSFRFQVGILAAREDTELAAVYTDTFKSILIKKPFVGLALSLDSDMAAEHVASLGEIIRAQIDWGNNLPVDVTEGKINLNFTGLALNRATVSVNDGFYRSADDVVVWDQSSVPELALLQPGDRGSLQLSFGSNAFSPSTPLKNPTIGINLIFTGRQNNNGRPGELIETKINRVVKLAAGFNIATRLLYYDGPYENVGPMPPQVNKETTYTVVWSVGTAANDVKDVKMKAILPAFVRWLGETAPGTEKMSFNEVTRELSWEVGYLATGPKGEFKGREVAFQVGVTPSVSQTGNDFNVLERLTAAGTDTFTNTTVSKNIDALSSRFSTDSGFHANDDRVVP